MQPTTLELFSGAGLLGAGFEKAGFKPIRAIDLDNDAITSYNKNLTRPVGIVGSVADIDKSLKCDIIIAGPPCQGFSTLGKRNKSDTRNSLSLLVYDWAKSTKAKVVVIENVPQFTKTEYYEQLVKKFNLIGYESLSWQLEANEYGVPQLRRRSFTIFSKIGLPNEPKKSKESLTVKDAFKGLRKKTNKTGMHSVSPPSELALKRMKVISKNGSKLDVMEKAPELCPESWFKLGKQAVDVWGRMDYSAPSNTIRCCFWNPSKGRYIHPTENRVITTREGARLQGVPDEWEFAGSKTSIARQIGNGVPVPLATAVARSIKKLF